MEPLAVSSVEPAGSMPGWVRPAGSSSEQALHLADGKGDRPGAVTRRLAEAYGQRGLVISAVPESGGGDGADREIRQMMLDGHRRPDLPDPGHGQQDRGHVPVAPRIRAPVSGLLRALSSFSRSKSTLVRAIRLLIPDAVGGMGVG